MESSCSVLVVKIVYISWCACLGCLARIYFDEIHGDSFALEGSFVSNTIGSFVLGILMGSDLSEDSLPGFYTGVTVGFCGSLTTYSGWNLRVARAALRDASGPGGATVAVVAVLVSLAYYIMCFVAGEDLVKTLTNAGVLHFREIRGGIGTARRALSVICGVYLVLALLLVIDDNEGRRQNWLSAMFAPIGALTRFFLSRTLDRRWQGGACPAGTFLANFVGCLALGITYYGFTTGDRTGWGGDVLQAFEVGLVGSLSTMSTFVGQVVRNREKYSVPKAYAYWATTAIVCMVVAVIVGAVIDDER